MCIKNLHAKKAPRYNFFSKNYNLCTHGVIDVGFCAVLKFYSAYYHAVSGYCFNNLGGMCFAHYKIIKLESQIMVYIGKAFSICFSLGIEFYKFTTSELGVKIFFYFILQILTT